MSVQLLSTATKIDFLGKRYIAFIFSALCVVASIYLWVSTGQGKFGIDYTGGHEIVVRTDKHSDDIRKALESAGLSGATVQSFEFGSSEYSVRLSSNLSSKEVSQKIVEALKGKSEKPVEVLKQDYVGPTIGEELKNKAYIAMALGLVGMLIYISYRFEFAFALGAVVALFHDVVVAMGAYLLAGHQVTVATLAAAMTIVGYSVNDTIVIFDRVREEIYNNEKMTLEEIINYSINATLARTIITSLLTFFSCLALYFVGGGAIADLTFYLLVGVIAGCYSTIFIASPVAIAWERWKGRKNREVAA
jgi:preprotein translocase subunit SecF